VTLSSNGQRIGRPSAISPELEEIILDKLAAESVESVFADHAMPDKATFYNHCKRSPSFFDASARARALRALVELDEAEKELAVATPANVPVIRERMQHARWKVSRMLAKYYGDRVEISGQIAAGVLVVPATLDTEDWAAMAERQQQAISTHRGGLPEAASLRLVGSAEVVEAKADD
jgi:hypothetical protein